MTHSNIHPARIFALIFAALVLTHIPLLRLPYFWDEAGYYIPAALDLLHTGSLIPQSSISNAHPPLVMIYLALWWKLAGFAPVVTRLAMLLIATFTLLGVFRLAQRVANLQVAVASTVCTAFYSVFFAQSSLAHLDMAAAGITFWGLLSYVNNRKFSAAIWFSLAVLTKETAILAPLALFGWEVISPAIWPGIVPGTQRRFLAAKSFVLLLPVVPLSLWYGYHFLRTGFVFGNPEFFRYNIQATLHPLRIFLALLMRMGQTVAYLNLYVLTLAALFAMWRPPLRDKGGKRPRIDVSTQLAFLAVIVTYVVVMAVIGGAVLARYLLPVTPLVIIVCISTLWRRVHRWHVVVAIVVLAFLVGLFVNPPYGFSLEDNLAYRDYVQLHQHAEQFLEARHPSAHVLTAWPASDELSRPYLGYVAQPVRVIRIEDFTVEQLMSAVASDVRYDQALVFSTKYEPRHPAPDRWPTWVEWKTRFFGFHRDVPPAAAAQLLGGRIVYSESREGQWIAVIEIEQPMEASTGTNFSARSIP